MGYEINIDESIEDKKSWFNIKRFKIGNTSFDRPEKSIDSKNINQEVFNTLIKEKSQLKFHEATKIIKSFQDIEKIYEFNEASKINEYFFHKKWLNDCLPNILNITFDFNPFNHVEKIVNIDWFFYRYYSYSKLFISIPNLRTIRTHYSTDSGGKRREEKETIINIDDYIKFVDSVYSIFKTKNTKPIFSPISLRMSLHDLDKLIDHYLKKEYYYYWFDFEGKAINEVNIGSIRYIFNKIHSRGYFEKIVSFFTNIKREILSNMSETENKSPASDVLSTIIGANIIGINREPPKNIKNKPHRLITNESIRRHKARIFDSESYYYIRNQQNSTFTKQHNISYNSVELDKEFQKQSDFFLSEHNIGNFLAKKEMLTNYKGGSILRELNLKIEKRNNSEPWF